MHSMIRKGLFRTVRGLSLAFLISAFMVPVPTPKSDFLTLPLPPGVTLSSHQLFAANNAREFLFFDPAGPPVLHYFKIDHPMGSRHFFHEQWITLPIPAPETLQRIRALALGNHQAYLSGNSPSGEPVLRMLTLSPRKKRILSYTDFMAHSGGAPIREIIPDNANNTVWLTFDNGQITAGHSLLLTPETILSATPGEALFQEHGKLSPEGPRLLPSILKSRINHHDCFSCRLYLIRRQSPEGESVLNVPVRSPVPVDLSMGMIPIGLSGALFAGDPSSVCHIPFTGMGARIGPCHPVNTSTLPADGLLWGAKEVFLLRRTGQSDWHLAVIDREWLEDPVSRNRPLNPDFPGSILKKKALFYRMESNRHPIPGFWSAEPGKVVLFGHQHLYLLLEKKIP